MIDIKNDIEALGGAKKNFAFQHVHFEKSRGVQFGTPSHNHYKNLEQNLIHQNNGFINNDYNNNQPAFDYNQWRGIKGLLNESNCYEMKQSIHCGPEIRSPTNFKL